jgi:ubiquinone/menaquinone biosynthesis C-methylase UbiE
MPIANTYADPRYAEAYARLEFPGTYHLAFRDLPAVLSRHARGQVALDFGCGAGRSTRFLRRCGFAATGVDVAEEMLQRARGQEPAGEYRLVPDGDLGCLRDASFDVVLSAFAFDNVPTHQRKVRILRELRRVLRDDGVLVNLVSSPEIYTHEWVSFSTRDYPENRHAASGDTVRIVNLAVADRRPVEDVLWTDEAYHEVYGAADLAVVETLRPLGRSGEPFPWVSETTVPPWVVYVLTKAA